MPQHYISHVNRIQMRFRKSSGQQIKSKGDLIKMENFQIKLQYSKKKQLL